MEDFVVLNNGVRMPRVGLGVYAIPVNQTKDAVLTALSLGYRHIDTAQLYKNEAEVGEAVRASGIPRKEIFVTTKLWLQDDQLRRGQSPVRTLSESTAT